MQINRAQAVLMPIEEQGELLTYPSVSPARSSHDS